MNQQITLITLSILIIVIIIFNVLNKNEKDVFWVWFSNNQDRIYAIKTANEPIADEVTKRLKNVDRNLTWEISGSSSDSKRDFIISAGGIRSSFPQVLKLVSESPKELNKFNIVAFRQKTDSAEITYGNKTRKVGDLYFSANPVGDKYDISIYVKDYENGVDDNIVYLFLDSWLGEYNTETKLAVIDIGPLNSQDIPNLTPFKNIEQVIK